MSGIYGELLSFPRENGPALTEHSSHEWDGRDSGFVISDISMPAPTIQFTVGQTMLSQTIVGESTPDPLIPDNQTADVFDEIDITMPGIVRRMKLDVDIKHTYIGDLIVKLSSPTGETEYLHIRQDGSDEDLIRSYDSDNPGSLNNMIGQPIQGTWRLTVSDHVNRDEGVLEKWRLEIETSSIA